MQHTTSGSSGQPIRFVGCNASGVEDGTRFTLDGNDGAFDILDPNACDYIIYENFRFTNGGQDGIDNSTSSTAAYWTLINCSVDNCAGIGLNAGYITSIWVLSTFYGNTGDGIDYAASSNVASLYFCSVHDNGGIGVDCGGYSLSNTVGCLIFDNGDDGIASIVGGTGSLLFGSVIDGNADDAVIVGSAAVHTPIFGNRITNHTAATSIALNVAGLTRGCLIGWNYFENNYGDNVQVGATSIAHRVKVAGTDTNVEDQSNTNQGYTSLTDGSEDFNLRSDASVRRTAVQIPLS